MKLSELKNLTAIAESASSEAHQEKLEALETAIMDEFNCDKDMAEKITDYLLHNADPEGVHEYLYDKFESEMPYNVLSDDPTNWIADHMEHIFSKYTKGL